VIEKNHNNSNDFDDEDADSDDNKFFDDDENNIDNIWEYKIFENNEEKDVIDNVNSELSQKEYNLEYLKYQHNLYSEIFGLNATEYSTV